MPLAITAVVLGVLALYTGIIIVPVAGFGLGASAMLRENRKDNKRRSVFWVAGASIAINTFMIVLMLLSVYL